MTATKTSRPRGALPRSRLVWVVPVAVVVVAALVLAARALRSTEAVQSFLAQYPGHGSRPAWAPVGVPAWLAWQHGLNALLMIFIIRSGWLVRTVQRPAGYWTRKNTGVLRTKNPPTKISINVWLHVTIDSVWLLNGVVFYVLLFATGQWTRIVPTSWDVFPNALSAVLQYASLDWPAENGWVYYNALQLLAYFLLVFVAAPLSIATGLRMSPAWPKDAGWLNRAYPIERARAMHFPLMIGFVAFIVVHLGLVFTTGMLQNLGHMFAATDEAGWTGFWVFAGWVVVAAALWLALRPGTLRALARLTGKVTRN